MKLSNYKLSSLFPKLGRRHFRFSIRIENKTETKNCRGRRGENKKLSTGEAGDYLSKRRRPLTSSWHDANGLDPTLRGPVLISHPQWGGVCGHSRRLLCRFLSQHDPALVLAYVVLSWQIKLFYNSSCYRWIFKKTRESIILNYLITRYIFTFISISICSAMGRSEGNIFGILSSSSFLPSNS